MDDNVRNNVQKFKKTYTEILKECIERRKDAGFTQEFMGDWLGVSRAKIVELEKGTVKVGLLLNYADKLDIEINLKYTNH